MVNLHGPSVRYPETVHRYLVCYRGAALDHRAVEIMSSTVKLAEWKENLTGVG